MGLVTLSPTIIFFLNDPTTPEIYTLPLHAALRICPSLKETGEGGLAATASAQKFMQSEP